MASGANRNVAAKLGPHTSPQEKSLCSSNRETMLLGCQYLQLTDAERQNIVNGLEIGFAPI